MLQLRHFTKTLVLGSVALGFVVAVSLMWGEASSMAQQTESKKLRHVVLFKFKDSSSKTQVQRVVDQFRKLPSHIAEIAEFEYGTNNSPEGLADGFTHCFLVTFRSEKDRDAYLPHQSHKEFVDVLKPHLDKVLVIDFWAGE